jgi:hypothetical protein
VANKDVVHLVVKRALHSFSWLAAAAAKRPSTMVIA